MLSNILNNDLEERSLQWVLRTGVVTRVRCLMEAVDLKEGVKELKEPMMWLAKAILEAVGDRGRWY